jgi:3-isopropylmalate/(R)-2-methylmalate dehydratase large subunit
MTISNMGVEVGAKFAFFETDETTVNYLKKRTDKQIELFCPDRDAHYSNVYEMDVSSLEPQVACPHDVDNVKSISEIDKVNIHQAFIGSCTNSRTENLERAARILKGRKVHSGTRLLINPASQEIYSQIAKSKVLDILLKAGAMIGPPGCGPCGGLHGGVLAPGEVGISSTNRNFKGRMGSTESFLYLGSSETVAASAIEGRIADPRKYLR